MRAFLIRVSGRVQGVGFRAYAREEARRVGVTGWVRNLSDGSVELFIQGTEKDVNEMVSWCYQGPPHAFVTGVELSEMILDESLKTFSVRF